MNPARPATVLGILALGGLGALGAVTLATLGCYAGSAPDSEYTLEEIPDRFARVRVPVIVEGAKRKKEQAPAGPEALEPMSLSASVVADTPMELEFDDSEEEDERNGKDHGGEASEQTTVRRWFPEAFLWRPMVQTGETGEAQLEVVVPDSLTTWRVLALAHDRAGQQAGTVHTFDSRLPIHVDPVVPGWLYRGDRVRLPVQVTNGTPDPISADLKVEAEGALSGSGAATVQLAGGGSAVRTMSFDVGGSGQATVTATLSGADVEDRVIRTIPVRPTGRPVVTTRGTTLAGRRILELPAPDRADPATDEIQVVVFPGPLAVLQSELERLDGGSPPEDGGYGFALAAAVGDLATQVGVEVDPIALRRVRLVAWQRIVRSTRAPDPAVAVDLLSSLGTVSGHDQIDTLLPRLVTTVEQAQRSDGTWSRDARSTVSRVLVDTAVAARALPASSIGARLRAEGAVERLVDAVDDPYTSAVLLASGLPSDAQAEALRERVLGALVSTEEGAILRVPADVRNPWGRHPPSAEVLAWGILALPDHPAAGDLASALMSRWHGRTGFGAGPADGIALEAVMAALPTVAQPIELTLGMGDASVVTAQLDPTQPKVPAVLTLSPGGTTAPLTLEATPPIAGLAVVATRRNWVPWGGADRIPGVDVDVSISELAVGRVGALSFAMSAPSGAVVVVEQGLPAGTTAAGSVRHPRVQVAVYPDRIRLTSAPLKAAEVLEITVPISPAFAGQFTTSPLTVSVDGAPAVALPPVRWRVAAD